VENVTDTRPSTAHEIAEALARLTAAVEALETAADHLDRQRTVPAGTSIEAARADLDALRELHTSVSRQLDTAIARLRVLVKSE
jgi:UDP-N-acetyl-D-mannosaminuronate dehydrogenase